MNKSLIALAAFALSALATLQTMAQQRPGPGGGGGGFERPLASAPRRGDPGASPGLHESHLKEIVTHAKNFDTNKDGKLSKAEVPEMFAAMFDRADLNHDGLLDATEMSKVGTGAVTANRSPAGPVRRQSPGPGAGGPPANRPQPPPPQTLVNE